MPWDFSNIIAFGRQFSGPAGTELAFVFSEWAAEDGLALTTDYPAVRAVVEPTAAAPNSQADRVFVDRGSGWEQLTGIAGINAVGLGTTGVLQSGVASSMVIAPWAAKAIAAGYIVATGATVDAINADRTTGIALIRTYINDDETNHPLAPSEPFTAGQVSALSAWNNDHGVTDSEFAALFGVSAAQLSNWLQTHTRVQFAQQIHERFT